MSRPLTRWMALSMLCVRNAEEVRLFCRFVGFRQSSTSHRKHPTTTLTSAIFRRDVLLITIRRRLC